MDGNFGSSDLDRLHGHWPSHFAETVRDDNLVAGALASTVVSDEQHVETAVSHELALESGCVLERYVFGMRPNFLALQSVLGVSKQVIEVQLGALLQLPLDVEGARRYCALILVELQHRKQRPWVQFADADGPPTGRDQRQDHVAPTGVRESCRRWHREALPTRSAISVPEPLGNARSIKKRVTIVGGTAPSNS